MNTFFKTERPHLLPLAVIPDWEMDMRKGAGGAARKRRMETRRRVSVWRDLTIAVNCLYKGNIWTVTEADQEREESCLQTPENASQGVASHYLRDTANHVIRRGMFP